MVYNQTCIVAKKIYALLIVNYFILFCASTLVSAIRPWRVTLVYVCVFVPTVYCLICIHSDHGCVKKNKLTGRPSFSIIIFILVKSNECTEYENQVKFNQRAYRNHEKKLSK